MANLMSRSSSRIVIKYHGKAVLARYTQKLQHLNLGSVSQKVITATRHSHELLLRV